MRVIFTLLLSSLLTFSGFAQCDDLEVDAGQDFKVCPDEDITLQGDITGNYTSFRWEPSGRVLNPFELFTTAVGPGTYRLIVNTPDDMNLIVNGDFAGGNASFTSDYTYVPPGPYPGYGYYTVGNNPTVMNGGWDDCADVTGEDQMMIVDGSDVAGLDVWCQTVAVNPNTDYIFIFHASSSYPDPSPPVLRVEFNGVPVASYNVSGSSCSWEEFITNWNSGGLTSVEICIENTNTARGGNDFVLDNIQFYGSCVEEDEVTVEVVEMPLDADDLVELPCPGQLLDLLLTDYPSFGPYMVNWTTFDGNIVSTLTAAPYTATVDAPGTYTVELVYNDGATQCIKSLDIEVEEGDVMLEAFPEEETPLACLQDGKLIAQDANPDNEYTWYSYPGLITSNPDTTFVFVSQEGTYYLIEIDPDSGCRDTTEIEVLADADFPEARITAMDTMNCLNSDRFYLDGSGSRIGADDDLIWSTTDGEILGSNDSIAVRIGSTGIYELVVYDTITGCSDTSQIEIFEEISDPEVMFPDELDLDCSTGSLQVFDLLGSTDTLNYVWEFGGATFNQDTFDVTAEGELIVRSRDDKNGCEVIDTITVILSDDVPVINWMVPDTINCNQGMVEIFSGLMAGDSLELTWSSNTGGIIGSNDGEMIEVNESGWYVLTVLNNNNGCSRTDSIEVIRDFDLPNISTQDTSTFSCGDVTIELVGVTDFSYPGLTWYWTTTNGSIVSDPNSDRILVDAPGEYIFIISNSRNGCAEGVTHVVVPDQNIPSLSTDPVGTIDCINDRVVLSANGQSSNGSNISYQWTTMDGVIMGNPNAPTLTVMDGGSYRIEIIDDGNGCRNAATLTVLVDTISPVVSFTSDLELDCIQSSAMLFPIQAENSDFDYQWNTADGSLPMNPNQHTIEVMDEGTYVLTVINRTNGCRSSESITVTEDVNTPVSDIVAPGILTCEMPSIVLDASNSSDGPEIDYDWSSVDGNFIDMSDRQRVEVDEPGTYQLVITNTNNFCSDTVEVEVMSNETYPIISIATPDSLGCENAEVQIIAQVSNSMSNTTQWSTSDGRILSSTTGNTITVDLGGTYVFRVEDLASGCITEDSVRVGGVATGPTGFDLMIDEGLCLGEESSIFISNVIGGEAPYRVELNGVGLDFDKNEAVFPGDYVLVVYDENDCIVSDTFTIRGGREYPVNIGLDFTITAGDYELLIPQFGFDTSIIENLKWSPSEAVSCDTCIRTEFISTSSVELILEVLTEDGCRGMADIFITVIPSKDVYIPNSFSPNADKLNDYFTVFARDGRVREVKHLRVFNRWGDMVFEKENFPPNVEEQGWDGRQNGEDLNPEVFIFTAEVEFINGSTQLFSGDVTLLK